MSDYAECAHPKTEAGWMGGVRMKDQNNPSPKQEIERFRREIQKLPDPNFGRIQELREKIKNGTLITKEAIEEAAERLTEIFLGKRS